MWTDGLVGALPGAHYGQRIEHGRESLDGCSQIALLTQVDQCPTALGALADLWVACSSTTNTTFVCFYLFYR